MPEKATARAMSPCARTFERMRLRRKVLPVPPGASKKMMPHQRQTEFFGE